jgi:hypothetical protein
VTTPTLPLAVTTLAVTTPVAKKIQELKIKRNLPLSTLSNK